MAITTAPSSDDHAHVAGIVRQASTSFFGAMRILPLPRRQAIFAVYAFCREVDDIADDDDLSLKQRKARLAAWRNRIDGIFAGAPDGPISRVLVKAVGTFELERDDFLAVIDGMEMDTSSVIVAPDRHTFELYCDRVACAVGRLCVKIFGEGGARGRELANAQGRALQITNILRDVHEDAGRGRLYLPADILEENGIKASSPEEALTHPNYVMAWRALADEAAGWFSTTDKVLAQCNRKTTKPSRIMLEVYRRSLERMMALPDEDIANPAISKRLVGSREKLLIALRYGLF
ncbi:MAG: presqualene diphosphate synthase HpnD [Hyphomicrobiales bacterium]